MNRELFVKKKRVYKKNPAPFEWEYGSYMAGEIINDAWVYYDYFGEDENPEKNRFEENTQKFSWSLIDEKYNDYRSLILTPRYIKILMNETGLSDQEVKEYICNVICKEDNDKVRERNNQKAKERRERNGR